MWFWDRLGNTIWTILFAIWYIFLFVIWLSIILLIISWVVNKLEWSWIANKLKWFNDWKKLTNTDIILIACLVYLLYELISYLFNYYL